MKRVKFLAVVLVVAIMLVGTAYALWNQNITLTTTAEMGEMDVAVIGDTYIYPLSVMTGLPYGLPDDYMNNIPGTITSEAHSINVSIDDLYPGAEYGLHFTIKNTGDVPVRLENVAITCTDNMALFNKMTGAFQFAYQSENYEDQYISVGPSAFSDGTLAGALLAACNDVVLYPGDELVSLLGHTIGDQNYAATFMQVLVDEGITGDQFEEDSTSFRIDFNWEQCQPASLSDIIS